MSSTAWLLANGPKELESLFRAVIYHPSAPILIADDDGNYQEASVGAGKLLGLPREKLIGRQLKDFAVPALKPEVSQLWRAFLDQGEKQGKLTLVGAEGVVRDVEFVAKGNILPVRHVLVLRDAAAPDHIPSWVQDYALYLVDAD